MTKYQARIKKQETGFFALVVRIDRDGEENVVNGFGRSFKTLSAAEKSSARYISKMEAM